MRSFFIVFIILLTGCGAINNTQRTAIRQLYRDGIVEDTSYIYSLPYQKGAAYRVVQGYYSAFTHKNRVAVDFKMKPGTKILAARKGVVVRLQEENNKGGWSKRYRHMLIFW